MHRKIVILLLASAFVITVHSDNVLKCYMCTSLSNQGCGPDLTTNSLQPVECTVNKMVEWQRSIQQHEVLSKVAQFFVDETLHGSPQAAACAKMILNVAKRDVIVRTCQTAKTEIIDPCKMIEEKLQSNSLGKMEQCTLCLKDACNGTVFLSSKIFYIFLSLFSTLIHIAFYH